MGNTCLYGATGGKLFAEGITGERFAVRNSGCKAVVEGVGDHACEYMTGGSVVVLGQTGNNFGAGMTGGLAFIYDLQNQFNKKYNTESIEIMKIKNNEFSRHQKYLLNFIKEHYRETGSLMAKELIENYNELKDKFLLIKPKDSDYKQLLDILIKVA